MRQKVGKQATLDLACAYKALEAEEHEDTEDRSAKLKRLSLCRSRTVHRTVKTASCSFLTDSVWPHMGRMATLYSA